jgi:UDP-N-acetyl-D-mannosaminuronic acid transferase (WecB/TagA/CpsF family)
VSEAIAMVGERAATELLGPNESALRRPQLVWVRVGGLMIDGVTHGDLVRAMHDDVLNARRCGRLSLPRLVFPANRQAVPMYHRYAGFPALLDQADVIHADGMNVVRAARWLTKRGFAERVATTTSSTTPQGRRPRAGSPSFF